MSTYKSITLTWTNTGLDAQIIQSNKSIIVSMLNRPQCLLKSERDLVY